MEKEEMKFRENAGARKEAITGEAEERMEDWFQQELSDFEEGEVVTGRIVQVRGGEVLVDVG